MVTNLAVSGQISPPHGGGTVAVPLFGRDFRGFPLMASPLLKDRHEANAESQQPDLRITAPRLFHHGAGKKSHHHPTIARWAFGLTSCWN
jgi:hypothetical protein